MAFNIDLIRERETPFYYYDMQLLDDTLQAVNSNIAGRPVKVHYAVKANANPGILKRISAAGFGADCVSGGEIGLALEAGFKPEDIFFAGVGKTDREIRQGLETGIGSFVVESLEELEVIALLAAEMNRTARIMLRVNPNIDAHTHHYITTGLEENKFGIDMRLLDKAVDTAVDNPNLDLVGLHFHIGSQITTNEPFVVLSERVNELVSRYRARGVNFRIIDLGGGLGVDYDDPDANPIPDFKGYFDTIMANLKVEPGQQIHCEPGRSIVAQCGSLISRVVYVKNGMERKFVILDAGMNDLLRPALYGAHHKIQNLTADSDARQEYYDVVGPVCESSDVFGQEELLPETHRGDIFALRSAGAYGESMASRYNARDLPSSLLV